MESQDNKNITAREYQKAEKTALRLLARAEQCIAGLSRKLEKRGFDEASINAVISKLAEINLLNDSRFARIWLRSRLRFTRSPRQLLSSLCARGIGHDDAQDAIKEVLDMDTELVLLARFAEKCKKKKKPVETKSLKYLFKNEGFSLQAIQFFLETD